MDRRTGSAAVGALGAAGFLVLAWVVGSGPVNMFSAPPASPPERRIPPPNDRIPWDPFDIPPGPLAPDGMAGGPGLGWVGPVLLALVWVALFAVVLLAARGLWRRRWRPPARPVEVAVTPLPSLAEAVAMDEAAHFAALEEGEPRNAIVACWLSLEESVQAAGVPRKPWETAAEFTERVLTTLAVDRAMLAGLAELYREARFSTHPLGESARRGALAALRTLHDDLLEHAGDPRPATGRAAS